MTTRSALDHTRRDFDGVVGFVDLAGFTTATENLGRHGPLGFEQLRDLINTLFTPAINVVHRAGGGIGWFAGDAIGAVFDGVVTPTADAVKALQQVSATIAELPEIETVAGTLTLGAKIGVAAGPVTFHELHGEPKLTWFSGPTVDDAAAAEGEADVGDVVLHDSVAVDLEKPDAGPSAVIESLTELDRQPLRVASLARSGNLSFLSQHRPATIMFFGIDAAVHDLGQLAQLVNTAETLGGNASVFEGDKGAQVMVLFGLPTAGANRQARAVSAALEMRKVVPDARIGITSGRVYSGAIGSDARWDYSAIGDRVNTAARLMGAAAAGEILIDDATLAGAPDFAAAESRELQLKGKAEPESAHLVAEAEARTTSSVDQASPFVGRRDETEAVRQAFIRPGVTLVSAVAGSGKTRLIDRALDVGPDLANAPDDEVRVIPIAIQQTDRGQPFSLWLRLLRALLDGDPTTPAQMLAALPDSIRDDDRLPLLGPVVGQIIEDTPLTASLSPEDRFEVMSNFVVHVLGTVFYATSAPRQYPLAIVEDLHWADEGSRQMLGRVTGLLAELGVVAIGTVRPVPEVFELASFSAVEVIDLEPIDEEAVGELATHLWTDQLGEAPTTELTGELVERSAGSPLFCEQLVAFAQSNRIPADATELPRDLGIPTSLTDLVLARLDALPEAAMTAATYGAVFGREFVPDDLRGAFDQLVEIGEINDGLDILADQRVIEATGQASAQVQRFTHSLFAETTHDRMSFKLRAKLHLAAIEHLERARPDELEDMAAQMARHADYATDEDRQRKYFQVAADQAAAAYANDVSTFWYRRLLDLHEGEQQGEIHLALGRIEAISGDRAIAEQHFALSIKALTPSRRTAAELGLVEVLVQQARPKDAFDLLDRVIGRVENDCAWAELRQALETKAHLATMLGDNDRAEEVEQHHAALADLAATPKAVVVPLENLRPMLWIRGDLDAARAEYTTWHQTLVDRGDLNTAAEVAADLAGIAYEQAELKACLKWLSVSRSQFKVVGNGQTPLVLVTNNEADLRARLGDFGAAAELCIDGLNTAIQARNLRASAWLLHTWGSLPIGPQASGIFERSLCLSMVTGNHQLAWHVIDSLGRLLRKHGRHEALELMRRIAQSQSELAENAQSTLALWDIEDGRTSEEERETVLRQSLSRSNNTPSTRAAILVSLTQFDRSPTLLIEATQACHDLSETEAVRASVLFELLNPTRHNPAGSTSQSTDAIDKVYAAQMAPLLDKLDQWPELEDREQAHKYRLDELLASGELT